MIMFMHQKEQGNMTLPLIAYCVHTFNKSATVSVSVSKLGCTKLIFVKPGVKVAGAYDVLISQQMLPASVAVSTVSAHWTVCLSSNQTVHWPIVHMPLSKIFARPLPLVVMAFC